MLATTDKLIKELFARYPTLTACEESIINAITAIIKCHKSGNKILVCGNGGSAADAEHIVGELMKGFLLSRRLEEKNLNELSKYCNTDFKFISDTLQQSVRAISLVSQTALMTAFANDQGADGVFAQQVYAYADPDDILIVLSTSGNSKNIVYAAEVAQYKNMKSILFTGESGGKLKDICDINICVPETQTYKVQEYHLPIYHVICAAVENELFGE